MPSVNKKPLLIMQDERHRGHNRRKASTSRRPSSLSSGKVHIVEAIAASFRLLQSLRPTAAPALGALVVGRNIIGLRTQKPR
jgi:hypothetical protein